MMLPAVGSTIQGLRGEGITDYRVWVNKSHYPGFLPWAMHLERGERIIVVVRNPLDSILSLFHLLMTLTMNKSVANDIQNDFPELWEEYVSKFSAKYEAYHKYWTDLAKTKEYPIIFVRYEDLLSKKKETLVDIFKFLFEVDSLDGLYVMDRIEAEMNRGTEVSGVIYKPRVGQALASLKNYTEE